MKLIAREYVERNIPVLKKFLPNELQFYAEKTRVHSGENCSSLPRKLFRTAEKLF